MKTKTLSGLTFLCLLLLGSLYSCREEIFPVPATSDATEEKAVRQQLNQASYIPGTEHWAPKGTAVETLANGSLKLTPPSGWTYAARLVSDGTVMAIDDPEVEVKCDCTEGSGCNPYYSEVGDGSYGCVMTSTCSKCEQSSKSKTAKVANSQYFAFNPSSGGFINLNLGISFETEEVERPMAFDAMFELPEVPQALEDFLTNSGLGILLNKEYSDKETVYQFPLNVFGRRMILDVPSSVHASVAGQLPVGIVAHGGDGKKGVNCDCSAGECEDKQPLPFVKAWYCDAADCTGTCTLTPK